MGGFVDDVNISSESLAGGNDYYAGSAQSHFKVRKFNVGGGNSQNIIKIGVVVVGGYLIYWQFIRQKRKAK